MLAKLFLIFTITSLVELALLIWLGNLVGLGPTIAIVCVTALVGAVLGKQQGLRAWRRIRDDLESARLPGDSILDGLAVLVASAFLLTPGVLTDAAALLLLIPMTRGSIKRVVRRRMDRWLAKPTSGLFGLFGSLDGGFGTEEEDPLGAGGSGRRIPRRRRGAGCRPGGDRATGGEAGEPGR